MTCFTARSVLFKPSQTGIVVVHGGRKSGGVVLLNYTVLLLHCSEEGVGISAILGGDMRTGTCSSQGDVHFSLSAAGSD